MTRRTHDILRRLGNIALGLVLIAALVFVANACINGLGTLPGGYRPLMVLSGSMEPRLPTGSLILVRDVSPTAVNVGDVITFRLDGPTPQCGLATHRVVGIERGPKDLRFVTQGDANPVQDPAPVPASALVGRVLFASSLAGSFVQTIKTPLVLGLMALGAVVLAADGLRRKPDRDHRRRSPRRPVRMLSSVHSRPRRPLARVSLLALRPTRLHTPHLGIPLGARETGSRR